MAQPTYNPEITKASIILRGVTPYSQSKYLIAEGESKKLDKEKDDAYDARIWREKGHWDKDDKMIVPAMQVKNMMAGIAKYLSEKIVGKGQATYTKHFKAGIIVPFPFKIFEAGPSSFDDKGNLISENCSPVLKSTVDREDAFPQTSSGNRIRSRYPIVHQWVMTGDVLITDQNITQDVFSKYLVEAGWFTGLGRYRIGNGSEYGRFQVVDITFESK